MGSLEFDQAGPNPKSAQSFRDGELHPTFDGFFRLVACTHHSEIGLLHLLRGFENPLAFSRQMDAVCVARYEGDATMTFELFEAVSNGVE